MKAKERHELKQNEFATAALRVSAWVTANSQRALTAAVAVALVVALVAGIAWWRRQAANEAGGLLGAAVAIAQSPIAPAPTIPGAAQQAGTYPTEEARLTATLEAYEAVIAAYPSSQAALTARYSIASSLLDAGRAAEAEQRFDEVIAAAGTSMYGPLARLGRGQALAAQDRHDEAIALFTELSADRTSPLPVDGVLIQLARTSARAGRTDEARAAFRRIVDEFPTSGYVAEARRELSRMG
ncbi:MAG TPA: tetratricopeptide repeat protein [Vicinamibacterales bacterium]|nr:tetratricopeptide repeat protein [Vicinamibacterales bacterium]